MQPKTTQSKTTPSKSETLLRVTGMSCGSCAARTDRALRDLPGVTDVRVDLRRGEALIRHEPGTSLDALIEAVREAGYDATPAQGAA